MVKAASNVQRKLQEAMKVAESRPEVVNLLKQQEIISKTLENVQYSAKEWVFREQEEGTKYFIRLEWKIIAQIFDRLLLMIFTAICIIALILFKTRIHFAEKEAMAQFPQPTDPPELPIYYYDYDYDYY